MSYSATLVKKIGTSGGDSIRVYDVTTDGATGNITIADVDKVKVLGVVDLVEDPAANAQVAVQAIEDGSTANQVNIKLWQATNSAAGAYKKCRLTLLCYDN
jgi:hypothetical protein